jgi:hypothetical protein
MTTTEANAIQADPIITEVRAAKRAIISEHGGDMESFFAGLRSRQAKNPRLVKSKSANPKDRFGR